MIHDILEAKLAAAGFIPGQTLFRGYMPPDCVEGVMSRVPLSGLPIDPYIPDYYKGKMQIVVRHKDPDLGMKMAMRVQKILTVESSREIHAETGERGEVHLDLFFPESLPVSYPRLDGNTYEWSQHFKCAFGMKSTL